VVIIGAGTAGLSAAKTLAELSAEVDVVVLEGRGRVGGRIDTMTLQGACRWPVLLFSRTHISTDGSRVDRGASYIHGCNRRDNWVLNLANELKVKLVREHGGYQAGWLNQCVWLSEAGGTLPRGDVNKAWNLFEEVRAAVQFKANELQALESDMSIGDFLERGLPKNLARQLSALPPSSQKVFSRLASTVWGYVGPIERLSARLMADSFTPGEEASPEGEEQVGEEPLQDEDALVVSGYDFLVGNLSRNVDVRLNKTARAVVCTREQAVVYTHDGDEYACDAVIVAVPLGVLQSKSEKTSICFVPPLSDKKVEAINALAMGAENKVIMQFRKPFWSLSQPPYMQTSVAGLRLLSLHHYGKPGVLVAHLCPPLSVEMENLSDDQVRTKIVGHLESLFDRSVAGELLVCNVTRWTQDPFCNGSYSYMPVGASFEHVHVLREPEGRLLFAGEHTSANDGQCVTGAFDTGHEAAEEAMQLLAMLQCEFCECWFDGRGNQRYCRACRAKNLKRVRFCVCDAPDDGREYVQCAVCANWYHLECMQLDEAPIDDFSCPKCAAKT
jgi:monoamine oxidase